MALEANVLTAITEAVRAALTDNPAQDAAAVATAAATAAVAVRASPENINSGSPKANGWPASRTRYAECFLHHPQGKTPGGLSEVRDA